MEQMQQLLFDSKTRSRVKSNRSSAHIPNVTKTVNFGSVSGNQHLINILTPGGSIPALAEGTANQGRVIMTTKKVFENTKSRLELGSKKKKSDESPKLRLRRSS